MWWIIHVIGHISTICGRVFDLTRPPNVHGLLLFHNTGAGKTCTSIHVIEEYLKMYTNPIVRSITFDERCGCLQRALD